jgi:hypothetical protein
MNKQPLTLPPHLQLLIVDAVPMTNHQYEHWLNDRNPDILPREIDVNEVTVDGYLIMETSGGVPDYFWVASKDRIFRPATATLELTNIEKRLDITFNLEDLPRYYSKAFLQGLSIEQLHQMYVWAKMVINGRSGALGVSNEDSLTADQIQTLMRLRQRLSLIVNTFNNKFPE